MYEKYNRKQITFRQLLALIHVWAMDNPRSESWLSIRGLGFTDDPEDDVITSIIESTNRGNITYSSRAELENDFHGTHRDTRVDVTFEEVSK
jgi:hypothetical protein